MLNRPAQVAVDQDNPFARLGIGGGQVGCRCAFAFPGPGAGDQEAAGRIGPDQAGKLNVGPQGPVSFGGRRSGCPASRPMALLTLLMISLDFGDRAQDNQIKYLLHVINRSDRIIQGFQQVNQTGSQHDANHGSQGNIAFGGGVDRFGR